MAKTLIQQVREAQLNTENLMSDHPKTLKTLSQYAKENGYTRQYVYQYLAKELNIVELPIFAEYNGVKYEVGKQKFIISEPEK